METLLEKAQKKSSEYKIKLSKSIRREEELLITMKSLKKRRVSEYERSCKSIKYRQKLRNDMNSITSQLEKELETNSG